MKLDRPLQEKKMFITKCIRRIGEWNDKKRKKMFAKLVGITGNKTYTETKRSVQYRIT